eukprot:g457.t1
MKFGKALQDTSEHFTNMPFVRYKQLKQILKCILLEADYNESSPLKTDKNENRAVQSKSQFVKMLYKELHYLNEYFIGKEEELVIRMQNLESASHDLDSIAVDNFLPKLVKFHGDITLLHHWEIINYTAFSKILKKHDKLISGVSIREAFLELLFHQPFYSTDLLDVLSKQCEKLIDRLVPNQETNNNEKNEQGPDLDELNVDDCESSGLSKLHYAIRTWRELGDNAHTPSTVLPWSKPLPESMKIWLESQDSKNTNSPLEIKEEDSKSVKINKEESCKRENKVAETKRSRSDENSSVKDSPTEVVEDRRSHKAARIVE